MLRRRASHPRKPICTVIRNANRPGLFAEPNERSVAQRESRAIENVELLKQQKRDRLAEIERSPADPAEEIAGIEFGNAGTDSREVVRGHDHGWFQRARQQ